MQRLASALLLFASVAAGQRSAQQTPPVHGVGRPLVTRSVSSVSQLHAAMDDSTVNDIVAANGTYFLANEAGLGCQDTYNSYFVCIDRDLTIRAAAGATVVLDGGNKGSVVWVKGPPHFKDVTASLQGLQIANGGTGISGGGISNDGTLTIANCEIHHNSVNGNGGSDRRNGGSNRRNGGIWGGGIWNGGTLTITDSEIHQNSAETDGGGIVNWHDQYSVGVLTVTNSKIHNNVGAGYGGGILNNAGTLTVTNSAILNNSADVRRPPSLPRTAPMVDAPPAAAPLPRPARAHRPPRPARQAESGGGIMNAGGTITITNSEVLYNRVVAGSNGTAGGGMYNRGATMHATNTTVCYNTPDQCDTDTGHGVVTPGCPGLNTCPASKLYVCNTDFLCEVAAPGQPGAESLAQCNATCHRALL